MISLDPKEILKMPYERVLIPEEEGGFSAYIAEFEGCFAQGDSADEALAALHETALAWLQAELDDQKDIPAPWNIKEFSGKMLLRLPKGLHREVARFADREGVSLNQYVMQKLAASVREDQVVNKLSELLRDMHPLNSIHIEANQCLLTAQFDPLPVKEVAQLTTRTLVSKS